MALTRGLQILQCIFARVVSPLSSYVFKLDSETSAVSKRAQLCYEGKNPFMIPRAVMADAGDQAEDLSISRAKILAKEM